MMRWVRWLFGTDRRGASAPPKTRTALERLQRSCVHESLQRERETRSAVPRRNERSTSA
jgi:hypothetical protein